MIAIDDLTRGLVIRPATSRERLLARLRAGSLDRQLAAGTAPETSPLLALRAGALVRPAVRDAFARSLQRLVHHATAASSHRPLALSGAACRNVRNATAALSRLIERLRSPGPVSARGMAIVKMLLTDGTGALYYPSRSGELTAVVHEALTTLDSSLIHDEPRVI